MSEKTTAKEEPAKDPVKKPVKKPQEPKPTKTIMTNFGDEDTSKSSDP